MPDYFLAPAMIRGGEKKDKHIAGAFNRGEKSS